ncbi:hypothetical protein V2154_13405 [Ewingella sp. CoE-038-23]|uniref:hypothetical protein n=1 Tax=Ewingella docleensis TaxID=3118588 RepID=UPI0033659D70
MSKESDFPAFAASGHPGQQHIHQEGISARDYFAVKAMQGVMASGTAMHIGTNHKEEMLDMALAFYSMADAMLEARNK